MRDVPLHHTRHSVHCRRRQFHPVDAVLFEVPARESRPGGDHARNRLGIDADFVLGVVPGALAPSVKEGERVCPPAELRIDTHRHTLTS